MGSPMNIDISLEAYLWMYLRNGQDVLGWIHTWRPSLIDRLMTLNASWTYSIRTGCWDLPWTEVIEYVWAFYRRNGPYQTFAYFMLSRSSLAALSLATANCSEHGTEIFSQENNQTLCLCNDLYTGGGDFFDTRIESTQFSLTCTASRVGEIVVWTIVVISSDEKMKIRDIITTFLMNRTWWIKIQAL